MYSYSNYYVAGFTQNPSFYAQQQALLAQGHQQTVPSQPVRRQHRPVSQLATAPSVPSQQLRLAPMPAALQQPQQQQKSLLQHQQQQASSTCETAGLQAQHSQSQSQSQPQQTRAPGLCSSCAMVVNSLRQTGITDQIIAENVCEQCKRNWLMACRGTASKVVAAAHASAHPAPAPSTSPLHFSYEKTPDISYVEEPPTPMILRDVFFTEKPVEDEDEVQFDSDGTDDTELLTPGRCLSPPMSPRDILVGDREMYVTAYCDLIIEEKVPIPFTSRTSRSVSLARPQAEIADTAASSPQTAGTSTSRSAISPSSSATVTPDPATPAEPDVVLSAQAADKGFARALHDKLTNPIAYPKGMMIITSRHGEGARDVADPSSPECTHPYHADSECDSPTVPTPDLVSSSKRKRSEENSDEEDSDRSSYVPRKILAAELPKRQHGSKTTAKLPEPVASDSDQSPSDSDNDSEYRPSLSANRRVAARKKKSVTAVKRAAARSTRGGTKRRQQEARKSREGSPAPLLAVEDSQSEAQQESHPEGQMEDEMEGVELTDPRPTRKPTIFQQLSDAGIDWCRYCGTTEGVNWRPGPWGKRTLCNKHGCDYKGYGFACKLPRLDLTGFMNESVEERDRPVLQLYCTVCHKQESFVGNVLVRCEGCPRAYHQNCHAGGIDDETVSGPDPWHCESACRDNLRRRRIVVELPRKKLPLMTTPKAQVSNASTEVPASAGNATGTTSRPRSSRRNSSSRS